MARLKLFLLLLFAGFATQGVMAGTPPSKIVNQQSRVVEVVEVPVIETVDNTTIGDPKPGHIKKSRLRKRIKRTRAQRKQKRLERRHIKKDVQTPSAPQGDNLAIAIILALLIPPLALYYWEDAITLNFWIDLILWVGLLGITGSILGAGLGVVFALVVILLF